MKDCLFCKIVAGEIPCYKVYEDDIVLAFLDISQATLGHTLVIPKEHFADLTDIPDDVLSHLILITKKIANAWMDTAMVKGVNLLNNCKDTAGQVIKHFHMHIIPRYKIDELNLSLPSTKLTDEEFKKTAESISKLIKYS